MYLTFATRDRRRALSFLKKLFPSCVVEDTADSAGPLLDLVERDIIRIGDPDHHPGAVFGQPHATAEELAEAKVVGMELQRRAMLTRAEGRP